MRYQSRLATVPVTVLTSKPEAPLNIRGEFTPIKTSIPGTWVSEQMPMMAEHLNKATEQSDADLVDELHAANFGRLKNLQCRKLDQGVSALLEEMDQRG